MESEELQRRIHNGDRAAFGILYDQYSRTVYSRALSSLDYSSELAKEVVKAVFIAVYQDIRGANAPFDVASRIARLTDMEAAAILRRAAARPVEEHAQPAYAQSAHEQPAYEQQPAYTQPAPAEAAPRSAAPQPEPVEAYEPQKTDEATPPEAETAPPVQPDEPEPAQAEPPAKPAQKAKPGKAARVRDVIVTVLICLLFAAFLWVLAGILMDSGILPALDLGYSFFNSAVYPLFKLGS